MTIWFDEFSDTILASCGAKMFFNGWSRRGSEPAGRPDAADKAEREECRDPRLSRKGGSGRRQVSGRVRPDPCRHRGRQPFANLNHLSCDSRRAPPADLRLRRANPGAASFVRGSSARRVESWARPLRSRHRPDEHRIKNAAPRLGARRLYRVRWARCCPSRLRCRSRGCSAGRFRCPRPGLPSRPGPGWRSPSRRSSHHFGRLRADTRRSRCWRRRSAGSFATGAAALEGWRACRCALARSCPAEPRSVSAFVSLPRTSGRWSYPCCLVPLGLWLPPAPPPPPLMSGPSRPGCRILAGRGPSVWPGLDRLANSGLDPGSVGCWPD